MAPKLTQFFCRPYVLTLPDIDRFSKLFYCQNQEKICNKDALLVKLRHTKIMPILGHPVCKLSAPGRGCHVACIYDGVLMYADDLLLISFTATV